MSANAGIGEKVFDLPLMITKDMPRRNIENI